MPLSEHEERILAEIERQLAADDPRFAARSRRGPGALSGWSRTLRLRLAVGLAVVGIVCVLLLAWSVAVAAVGMVLILGAILLGATAVKERVAPTPSRAPSPDDAL
jgi:Flp pilus assembly protein TadB